jgi:hypothetical protein
MGRRSSLDSLPVELRDLFHRLVRDGHTIPVITDKLNELDADVSQSSIGRSVKAARDQMKVFKEAQEVAKTWVQDMGENPQGDVGVLCAQLLTSLSYQTLSIMAENNQSALASGEKLKPTKAMDLMLLAKTVKDLEATSKQSIERREKIERKVLERQAKLAEGAAIKAGVTHDQFAVIRAKFLGIPLENEA